MEYRFLGKTGLQVSCIGFGNMVNYYKEDEEKNIAIVKKAFESGINFFDTAENYGAGQAEEALGRAIKALNIPREQLVITTKIINRVDQQGNPVNRTWTLNRKHIIEGVESALKRLQTDYVDVVFAHLFDPETPMEEICRGFNQVIEDGKAFYWATSNWNVVQIQEAINLCDRLGLHRPVADQCQYNMINRKIVEIDFGPLFDNFGYGTTIWSPLGGGLLTGKYNDGIPEDSRVNQGLGFIPKQISDAYYCPQIQNEKFQSSMKQLSELSKELDCTQAQLALAWTLKNKDVSTAIIGAKSVQQLEDSLGALKVLPKLTQEVSDKIEKILDNRPAQGMDWRKWAPLPNRR